MRNVRFRLVEQRTGLANQIRGLTAEYGIVISVMRNLLQTLYCDLININGKIDDVTQDIITLNQQSWQSQRYKAIKKIPGFGPILTAAIVSKVGSSQQFRNGRQYSA